VFEIVGYLWLTPSVISLFYPLILLIGSLLSGSAPGILFSIIPFAIFGAGVFLLSQYYRHARGLLGEEKITALWIGTLVFNLLFLAPSLYGFYSMRAAGNMNRHGQEMVDVVWGLLIVWWSAAVLLSITGIMTRFKNQKYR
jgi:hypothetical protein